MPKSNKKQKQRVDFTFETQFGKQSCLSNFPSARSVDL